MTKFIFCHLLKPYLYRYISSFRVFEGVTLEFRKVCAIFASELKALGKVCGFDRLALWQLSW